MRMPSPRDKSKPDHDLVLTLHLPVLAILGMETHREKGIGHGWLKLFLIYFFQSASVCELNMTSCPLSSLPQIWVAGGSGEGEESGMDLLVFATVRQTDLEDLWVLQMCKAVLGLVRNSEDSLEQYRSI